MKKIMISIATLFIAASSITPLADAKSTRLKVHTVKQGDTVSSIAKHYHVTPAYIKKWNKLVLDASYTGDHLVVSNPNNVRPVYTRNTPDIHLLVNWFKERQGKVSYVSYAGRWGPATYDCSSSIYAAMIHAGYLPKQTVLGDTTTMFAQEGRLFTRISKKDVRYGDIFIMGSKQNNRGAAGHTGIILNKNTIIHTAYNSPYNNGIMTTSFAHYAVQKGKPTYYYRINTAYIKQLKKAGIFENSLGAPTTKINNIEKE